MLCLNQAHRESFDLKIHDFIDILQQRLKKIEITEISVTNLIEKVRRKLFESTVVVYLRASYAISYQSHQEQELLKPFIRSCFLALLSDVIISIQRIHQ